MPQSGRRRPNRFAATVCDSPWRSHRRSALRRRPHRAPTATCKSWCKEGVSLECLSDAEEIVEMLQCLHRALLANGIARGIEVVADIAAHRPHRRLVADANADRLRIVAEIAGHRAVGRRTCRNGRLLEAHQPTQYLVRRGEHVAHVMK